jgi:hypothetical protein
MTPMNICNPQTLFSPAAFKAPDMEALKPLMASGSKVATLFADHAGRQLALMGRMSADLFAAGAKIATATAEPGKLETVLKSVSEDLTASVRDQAEAMSAGARELQEGLMAALSETAKA